MKDKFKITHKEKTMGKIDIETLSTNHLINNNKVLKKNRRFETLRLYNFHLVRTNKISFEKYKKGVISLKILIDNNWDKLIAFTSSNTKKEEESSLNFFVQKFEQETTSTEKRKRKLRR